MMQDKFVICFKTNFTQLDHPKFGAQNVFVCFLGKHYAYYVVSKIRGLLEKGALTPLYLLLSKNPVKQNILISLL